MIDNNCNNDNIKEIENKLTHINLNTEDIEYNKNYLKENNKFPLYKDNNNNRYEIFNNDNLTNKNDNDKWIDLLCENMNNYLCDKENDNISNQSNDNDELNNKKSSIILML